MIIFQNMSHLCFGNLHLPKLTYQEKNSIEFNLQVLKRHYGRKNFLYCVILGTVNGVVGLAGLTRFGVKHQTFWTMDDAKKQGAFMNVSTNR